MKISIYEGCTATTINVEGNDLYSLPKEDIEDILVGLILESDITEPSNKYDLVELIKTLIANKGNKSDSYCEQCDNTVVYTELEF